MRMKYQAKPYIALQLTPIDSVHQVRAHYVTSTNLLELLVRAPIHSHQTVGIVP